VSDASWTGPSSPADVSAESIRSDAPLTETIRVPSKSVRERARRLASRNSGRFLAAERGSNPRGDDWASAQREGAYSAEGSNTFDGPGAAPASPPHVARSDAVSKTIPVEVKLAWTPAVRKPSVAKTSAAKRQLPSRTDPAKNWPPLSGVSSK
jgi:hypothetical protein